MTTAVSLVSSAERRIYDIVNSRVISARKAIRREFTSSIKIKSKLWIVNNIAYLLIDDERAIVQAAKRHRQTGNLFPNMIAFSGMDAGFSISPNLRKVLIAKMTLDLGRRGLFDLGQDSGAGVFDVQIRSSACDYRITGSLFVLRIGQLYFEDNLDDAFDEMIAYRTEALAGND